METNCIVILTTCASMEEAIWIEHKLLQEHLAACVQKETTESSYFWKGELLTETEVRLMIKTKAALFSAVEGAIRGGTSYRTPEIIAIPIVAGSYSYLKWLERITV